MLAQIAQLRRETANLVERAPRGVSPELHRSWPKANRRSPRLTSAAYLTLQKLTDDLTDARDRYVRPGASILDVGCGPMPYYPLFAGVAGDYAGADAFPGPNVRFVCPAEDLAIPDESFDVALSTQMLEHVRDPRRCVSEIRRVLRPGGIALLSAPGTWPYHPVPDDYWRYTHQGFQALVEDGGLEVLQVVPQGASGSCMASMAGIYLTQLAPPRRWGNRLASYGVALLNLLGLLGDRWFPRFAHPHEHSMIVNYLVVARRAA